MLAASRRGDNEELARLRKQYETLRLQARRRDIDALRQTTDGTIDTELVEEYLALLPQERQKGFRHKQEVALGPYLGQVPPDDRATERITTQFGFMSRRQKMLEFNWLSFTEISQGAPAIVQWLQSSGCNNFRYELTGSSSGEQTGGVDGLLNSDDSDE